MCVSFPARGKPRRHTRLSEGGSAVFIALDWKARLG